MDKFIEIVAFDAEDGKENAYRMFINIDKISLVFRPHPFFTYMFIDGMENPICIKMGMNDFMKTLMDFKKSTKDILWIETDLKEVELYKGERR